MDNFQLDLAVLYCYCFFFYISNEVEVFVGFLGSAVKRICLQCRGTRLHSWVGKIPWRRAWQPTPVFLPGESPWTEEQGGPQSMGSQRVGHNWATKHSTEVFIYDWFSHRVIDHSIADINYAFLCNNFMLQSLKWFHTLEISDMDKTDNVDVLLQAFRSFITLFWL